MNPVTRLTVNKKFWPPLTTDHPLPKQSASNTVVLANTEITIVKPLYEGEASLYLATAMVNGRLLSSWLSAEEFE